MIEVREVNKKDRNELNQMYYELYQKTKGSDWTSTIPFTKLRELLDYNKSCADLSTNLAFGIAQIPGVSDYQVLGLYSDSSLIGFSSVCVTNDGIGEIHDIYIKPEYRRTFIKNLKNNLSAIELLKEGIEDYFKNRTVDTISLEVPHTVTNLKSVVESFGFSPEKKFVDATKYTRR